MRSTAIRLKLDRICPEIIKDIWKRIKKSEAISRFSTGALWAVAGAAVSRSMTLLAFIFIARMVGRDIYGELGIIRSTINMFVVFGSVGMGLSATKYMADFRKADPARAGNVAGLCMNITILNALLISTTVYICAPWIAEHLLNATQITAELRISATVIFISAIIATQNGILSGLEAFKSIAQVNFLTCILSFLVLVCFAYYGGIRGAVVALGINAILHCIFLSTAIKKEIVRFKIKIRFRCTIIEFPILMKFGLPAVLSGIMVSPVVWLCNAILVNQSGGYGQMGIFDAANQWLMIVIFLPSIIAQTSLPMLSNYNYEKKRKEYLQLLKLSLLVCCGTAMLISIPIACLSQFIMSTYGAEFEPGRWVLMILAPVGILMAVNIVIGQIFAVKERMWIGLLLNGFWAVALILFSYIFIMKGFGALGLGFAYLIAYLLHSMWCIIYAYRLLNEK